MLDFLFSKEMGIFLLRFYFLIFFYAFVLALGRVHTAMRTMHPDDFFRNGLVVLTSLFTLTLLMLLIQQAG